MTNVPNSLEAALQAAERDAEATLRTLAAAVRSVKRAKAAAASGQLRDLQQALEATAALAAQAATAAGDLEAAWQFDASTHFSSGEYAKELLACAAEAGLQAFESDDLILSYPAIVQVSASDTAVIVDKKKERKVRPSVLVDQLVALQQRIAQHFLFQKLRRFNIGKLQQLDRLPQLRRHHQALRLPDIKAGSDAHAAIILNYS